MESLPLVIRLPSARGRTRAQVCADFQSNHLSTTLQRVRGGNGERHLDIKTVGLWAGKTLPHPPLAWTNGKVQNQEGTRQKEAGGSYIQSIKQIKLAKNERKSPAGLKFRRPGI